jgi:2,5-diamino-6-(ribosylamino)-4(3H)-pyrimidinone 5'-phosphate reductase
MKPYVICHMCTSIDGKVIGQRWGKLPGSKDVSKLYETTAASFGIPAWVVGTTTMKEFAGRNVALKKAKHTIDRTDHIANPKAKSYGIGTDAKGVLRFQHNEINGDHVVLLLSEQVSDDYLAHLQEAQVSYLFCGREQVDPRVACRKIGSKLGLRKLMLEGGGTFNGVMLKAGQVDEISQVILPVVDGGAGIQGFFDIPGKAPSKAAATLKVLKHQTLPGGIHWIRYRVTGKP